MPDHYEIKRLGLYLSRFTDLAASDRGSLLANFASRQQFVLPKLRSDITDDVAVAGYQERAELIAKFGLLAEEPKPDNSALIAKRREAISAGFFNSGLEAHADKFAADLTMPVTEARSAMQALKALQPKPQTPTVEERAAEGNTFGGSFEFRPLGRNHSETFARALDRAGAITTKKDVPNA